MNIKILIKFIKKHNFLLGSLLTVLFISLGFFLSLKLSLYGDDWLRLHILRYMFDTGKGMSYFSISSYLGPYNSQYIFLFFIRLFWGYNPFGYFLASLILRILGAIAFYFPFKKITKSSLISWFGAILIGTTPIGIQVTDWVFYMNTYASLIFLSATIFFLLKMEEFPSVRNQVLIFLSSILFIFIIPVRSYGFFFSLLVLSIIKIIWQKNKKRKFAAIQLVGITLIYTVAKIVGSLGPTTDVISSIQAGAGNSFTLLTHHNYSFILVPFINLGRIIFPEMLYQDLQKISVRIFQPQIISMIFLFLILGIGYYFWKNVSRKRFLVWAAINIFVFPLIQIIFVSVSMTDQMYASISLWILFNTIYYLVYSKNHLYQIVFVLLVVCFSLPYYLLPWSFSPSIAFNSDHRYLYFPAIGLTNFFIILASIFFKNKNYRKFIVLSILCLTLVYILSDNTYFGGQLRFRSEARQQKLFTSLHKIVPALPKDSQSIFYVTDTTGKRTDVYSFGFPFYMGLSYDISGQGMLPFILPDINELHSAVTDGKVLSKYTQTINRADPQKIYYLKLMPDDTFVLNKSEVLKEIATYGK